MATITTINPIISICIANYNGEHLLTVCIQSVINQSFDQPIEIIVHDDASTDHSVNLMRSQFPQVILIESQNNVGFCISNNRMVAAAKGEFILLLNNDAALYPNALCCFYNYAKQQKKPGILGLPQYHMETGELIDRGSVFDPFLNPIPNLDKNRTQVGMVIGACLWIPKTLWQKLGGFPEWFHTLAEDMFICCYARLSGYPVEVLSVSGFKHWVGQNIGGGKVVNNRLRTTVSRRALSERNKTFTMLLCYSVPVLFVVMPIHLILLIIEGFLLSLIKWDFQVWREIYWKCLSEIWAHRKILRQTRKRIQQEREVSVSVFFKPYTLFPHKLRMLWRHGFPEVR